MKCVEIKMMGETLFIRYPNEFKLLSNYDNEIITEDNIHLYMIFDYSSLCWIDLKQDVVGKKTYEIGDWIIKFDKEE